ncbi:MAG TPA: hypothetical protein VD932_08680 [Aquabacterium sp.]|nr:hypothetical protein [Aquabacterium sp.]
MRLSTDPCDAGYHPQACRCRIYLQGAARWNVITADEEKRYALLLRLDQNGNPKVLHGKRLTDEFWGDVRIELPLGGLPPAPSIDCEC